MPHLSPAAWDDPVVAALTTAQQAELRTRYGGDSEPRVHPPAAYVREDEDWSLYFERTLA